MLDFVVVFLSFLALSSSRLIVVGVVLVLVLVSSSSLLSSVSKKPCLETCRLVSQRSSSNNRSSTLTRYCHGRGWCCNAIAAHLRHQRPNWMSLCPSPCALAQAVAPFRTSTVRHCISLAPPTPRPVMGPVPSSTPHLEGGLFFFFFFPSFSRSSLTLTALNGWMPFFFFPFLSALCSSSVAHAPGAPGLALPCLPSYPTLDYSLLYILFCLLARVCLLSPSLPGTAPFDFFLSPFPPDRDRYRHRHRHRRHQNTTDSPAGTPM